VTCPRCNPFDSAFRFLAWLGVAAGLGVAAIRAADARPTPPPQSMSWKAPVGGDIPTNFVTATEALFDAGMADPRGGEYRSIVVRVGSLWSGDGGKVATHGWVLPGSGAIPQAVCWNGLVYPVLSIGTAEDLTRDVQALKTGKYEDRGWIPREADGVSYKYPEPLKGCLLLRLGETDLARDYWISLQERDGAAHFTVSLRPERKTFQDKKTAEPTNAEPARLDPRRPDPFSSWAKVWVGGALDRVLTAHMRGDDAEALEGARWLVPVRERINAIGKSRQPGSTNEVAFPSLDVVLPLLKDQERRASSPEKPLNIDSVAEIEDAGQRVKAAISMFAAIAVRQRSQYSGAGSWLDAPQFSLVVEAGQAAVEPLLAALDSDAATRLTRSVSFERDYLPGRTVHPVSEVLVAALKTLLRIDNLDSVIPPGTIAEAGTNAHRVVATGLREYIGRAHAMTAQESWYATLKNDKAVKGWPQAIRDIVAPNRTRLTFRRRPLPGAEAKANPLAGEILREKTDPTVTELMLQRIGRWTPIPGDPSFGLTEFREKIDLLARWDAAAALDLNEKTLGDCLRAWETEAPKPDRNAALSTISARAFSSLVVEMAKAGRTNLLDLYASWILKVGDRDYGGWIQNHDKEPNPLAPLWLFPAHPTIAESTVALLDPVRSPLHVWLTLDAGLRSFYVIEAGTGLSGLPVFQKHLVEALKSKTEAGTIMRPGSGLYEVTENTGVSYTRRLFADRYLATKLPDMKLRLCDAAAKNLDNWPDLPRFELYWNENERDARIEDYIRLIETEGSDFGRRATKEHR
jgi:hypothetical protein